MSKPVLQKLAAAASGVTYEESLEAARLEPTVYERLGGDDGVRLLSCLFYDRVYEDGKDEPGSSSSSSSSTWFLNIFSSSTKEEAIDNQYRFLVQTFGGPSLYSEKKGRYTRLAGRHATYSIGPKAAERWSEIMAGAMRQHPALKKDDEALRAMERYRTALCSGSAAPGMITARRDAFGVRSKVVHDNVSLLVGRLRCPAISGTRRTTSS
jgi:hemoglobin